MRDSTPISILLPLQLRARLERQAQKRSLKLSTVLKVLVDERLTELEASEELTQAEEWQRAEAWGAYERHRRGETPEASWQDVDQLFAAAKRRLTRTESSSPAQPPGTSLRSSRGSKPKR